MKFASGRFGFCRSSVDALAETSFLISADFLFQPGFTHASSWERAPTFHKGARTKMVWLVQYHRASLDVFRNGSVLAKMHLISGLWFST